MPDYLAIATQCADDIEPRRWGLLGLSDIEHAAFSDRMAVAACIDLQMAIDGAFLVGQFGAAGTQVPLFRMAA